MDFGLLQGASLADLVQLEDEDELISALPLDEALDELAQGHA